MLTKELCVSESQKHFSCTDVSRIHCCEVESAASTRVWQVSSFLCAGLLFFQAMRQSEVAWVGINAASADHAHQETGDQVLDGRRSRC